MKTPPMQIHRKLPPMRLVNLRTGEHIGPCPLCGGGTKRFHVWTKASRDRPAWRYWCRDCNRSGLIAQIFDDDPKQAIKTTTDRPPPKLPDRRPPNPDEIPYYRAIYAFIAQWAHTWLMDDSNPRPMAALAQRGIQRDTAARYLLGYSLNDPNTLINAISAYDPHLIPYLEPAGVVMRDDTDTLVTHWHLRGSLIFPTRANSIVTDIRTRKVTGSRNTRSLPGSPTDRGAIYPMGWDDLDGADTVIITEGGEYKALVPLQAYHGGAISVPTLGHPGLNNLSDTWLSKLRERGIHTALLAYDAHLRTTNGQGNITLTPEEIATIRNGLRLRKLGLRVAVIQLPPPLSRTEKEDIDHFLLIHGTPCLQQLINAALPLTIYHKTLPRILLKRASLPTAVSHRN